MSAHRFLFYSPEMSDGDETVAIAGEEYNHLTRVLRAGVGDDIFVTNGRGLLVGATVEQTERERGTARIARIVSDEPPRRRVTLALAMLRKSAFERAMEMCTEAGITECVPFVAAQGHVNEYSTAFMERLRRVAVSAMKQSFRSLLPRVAAPESFDAIVARCRDATLAVVGDDQGSPVPPAVGDGDVLVVVGPEAGLDARERESLQGAGAVLATASPYRLRAETAALVLVSRVVGTPD
jgi:16S rRNA (uracil1498-N3)-methyltransferase